MKVRVLGRDRWYYNKKLWAKLRALFFKLQGYETIIGTVYLLKNHRTKPYMIGWGEIAERPNDALDGVWFRVIPYVREKGNVARGC